MPFFLKSPTVLNFVKISYKIKDDRILNKDNSHRNGLYRAQQGRKQLPKTGCASSKAERHHYHHRITYLTVKKWVGQLHPCISSWILYFLLGTCLTKSFNRMVEQSPYFASSLAFLDFLNPNSINSHQNWEEQFVFYFAT